MDTPTPGKDYLRHDLFKGTETTFQLIDADRCDRGYFQTRKDFDEQSEIELAEAIKQTGGNFNPIIVRPRSNQRYEIIAGERRVRAIIRAGLSKVMALIGDFSDEQAAVICITENLQRQDLNIIEEAEGIKRMLEQEQLTQKDVAVLLGKSRPYVSNMTRILLLDSYAQDLLRMGKIELGHAKALLGLKSKPQQRELAIKCARNRWSVRYLEDTVRKRLNPDSQLPPVEFSANRDIAHLEELLSETICHPCRILFDRTSGGGELRIHFAGTQDFDGIIQRLDPGILEQLQSGSLGFYTDADVAESATDTSHR